MGIKNPMDHAQGAILISLSVLEHQEKLCEVEAPKLSHQLAQILTCQWYCQPKLHANNIHDNVHV